MQAFLDQLHPGSLRGIQAAAFDTRVHSPLHGDAAGRVARRLRAAGAHILARPTGFLVDGKTGPLAPGELDRAREWADQIVTALASSVSLAAGAADSGRKVRVAIIGHTGRGDYGHGLDTVWLKCDRAEIVAVADASASKKKSLGVKPGAAPSKQLRSTAKAAAIKAGFASATVR